MVPGRSRCLGSSPVLRWIDFAHEAPDVARRGRELLFQRGEGFAFLATIDAGGAPRLHPIVVAQEEGGLYALLTPSPKRRDLERDPRYALHAFPHPDRDDKFVIRGRAEIGRASCRERV